MIEVAILLVSISIFLEFGGLAFVLFILHMNQKKNMQQLKDMNSNFEKLNLETRKVYEDAIRATQQHASSSAMLTAATNLWNTKGAKN